jgi:hypothetical protein
VCACAEAEFDDWKGMIETEEGGSGEQESMEESQGPIHCSQIRSPMMIGLRGDGF